MEWLGTPVVFHSGTYSNEKLVRSECQLFRQFWQRKFMKRKQRTSAQKYQTNSDLVILTSEPMYPLLNQVASIGLISFSPPPRQPPILLTCCLIRCQADQLECGTRIKQSMKPDQTMGRLFNPRPSWALLLLLVLLLSERSTNKTNQLSIEAEFMERHLGRG